MKPKINKKHGKITLDKSKKLEKMSKDYNRIKNCPHPKLYLFNKYYNLYYCDYCDSYWTPTRFYKYRVEYSYTIIDFSPEDDRIRNVWCENLMRKYYKSEQYKKDKRESEKFQREQRKKYMN
jgi:hypothetical protein